MARIQLTALPSYASSFAVRVRTTDLNYGGHLGNDRVLSLVHEARVAFLAEHGWTELACAGTSLIMKDAAVDYRAEAFANDSLDIRTAATEPGRCGFRLCHRLIRASDEKDIALVETGLICFDYQSRSIRPLPAEVAAICRARED